MADKKHRGGGRPTPSTAASAPDLLEEQEVFPDNAVMQELLAAQQAEGGALTSPAAAAAQESSGGPGWGAMLSAWLGDADLQDLLTEEQQEGIVWDESDRESNQLEADIIGKDEYRIPQLRISSIDKAGVQAADVRADGLVIQEQDKVQGAHRGQLSVDGASTGAVTSAEASAASVELDGLRVQRGWRGGGGDVLKEFFSQPGDTGVSVEGAQVTGLKAGGAELGALEIQDGQARLSQGGNGLDAQASVGRLSAQDVSASGLSVDQVQAQQLAVAGGQRGEQRWVGAGASGASLEGLRYAQGGQRAQLDALQTGPLSVSASQGGVDAQVAGITANGASYEGVREAGAASAGVDPALVQQLAALVKDASAQASVPMIGGKYGEGGSKMRVFDGTAMLVELTVKDGQLVPASTKITSSKDIDTLLWTTVSGAYMTPDGRVLLDVKGWGDQDLTQQIKVGLGLSGGGGLPLELATLAQARPSDAPASAGGGRPPPQDALNLDGATGSASISLNPGQLNAGGVSATLGEAPGANTLEVDRPQADRLSVKVTQLLLSAVGLEVGAADVDVKGLDVTGLEGGQRDLGGSTETQGSAQQLQADSLSLKTRA